mmetsp:Transcript_10910/g.30120  ORF Transcript_10910/g.30120 Transcript_10910/m.30120 type:complete len:95 (+) Transcript_10910:1294-1578(+)
MCRSCPESVEALAHREYGCKLSCTNAAESVTHRTNHQQSLRFLTCGEPSCIALHCGSIDSLLDLFGLLCREDYSQTIRPTVMVTLIVFVTLFLE